MLAKCKYCDTRLSRVITKVLEDQICRECLDKNKSKFEIEAELDNWSTMVGHKDMKTVHGYLCFVVPEDSVRAMLGMYKTDIRGKKFKLTLEEL